MCCLPINKQLSIHDTFSFLNFNTECTMLLRIRYTINRGLQIEPVISDQIGWYCFQQSVIGPHNPDRSILSLFRLFCLRRRRIKEHLWKMSDISHLELSPGKKESRSKIVNNTPEWADFCRAPTLSESAAPLGNKSKLANFFSHC